MEQPSENGSSEKVNHFASEINVPVSISKILFSRGITNPAEAKKFFVPELKFLHNPFEMKDLDKAADRIIQVINNRERILIFGDYDVDGTAGVSMFHMFMKEMGVPNLVFIPDRFMDGYGLSQTGINVAEKEDIKLIISIDCGITAYDKVEYAKTKGIEIIICDHHQAPEHIPDAYAVLDPERSDCNYPFKSLCGTGVAFKLIQAVCQKIESDFYLKLLDFVAVATAADMVPVIDENRVLLHFGFNQIKEKPRPSFDTLIRNAGFNFENICTSNVVFSLGPRINAVGRLGDGSRAVEFLTCDDYSKVEELAEVLEFENTNRKKIDSEIFTQAQDSYEKYINEVKVNKDDVAIILHNPEWHPGVLGIIASRMVEKYYKPSIILTTFNGHAKGSARSISNFNIYEALKQCSQEFTGLVQFGGHYHAAGLELMLDRIDDFRECFNKVAKDIISGSELGNEILIPEIKIDSELTLGEIDRRFVKILKHFEPFGPSNMTPVFLSHDVQIVGDPRVYNHSTMVFKVRGASINNGEYKGFTSQVIDCIFYHSPGTNGEDQIRLKTGDVLDIVYSVEENHWNGKTKTQLRLRDFSYKN
ncbi:MAG: single-stranded-DNA-specific exonuclease RecJ [Ignavibacteria bacterium]